MMSLTLLGHKCNPQGLTFHGFFETIVQRLTLYIAETTSFHFVVAKEALLKVCQFLLQS